MNCVKSLAVVLSLCLCGGCSAIQNARRFERTRENQGAMPAEYAQPRLGEVLSYLSEHGLEVPQTTSVFALSFWGMYGDVTWEEHARHPQYEGATIDVEGTKVIFAISPVSPWKGESGERRRVITTHAIEDGRPNGASVLVEGKTWTVGYTMQKGDEQLEKRLTAMVVEFLDQWAAHD